MKLEDLPDLSDWQFVEVFTLEEAAFLWGGIDPATFPERSLEGIQSEIHPHQFNKAWIARKSFKEAICMGTLPFIIAYETHEQWNSEPWEKAIDFPNLPDIRFIDTRLTRVSQAALRKWAKGKVPSLRQKLKQNLVISQIEENQPQTSLLLPSSYTTKAIELLQNHVSENLAGLAPEERFTAAEQKEWLRNQGERQGLSQREIDSVYAVARPPETKQRVQPKNKKK